MSKRHSAKYKLDRTMGENLWGRPKSPVNQRSYGPGQHGQRRRQKISDFGLQLRAKQKLKGYYGNLTEKQFAATYKDAARKKGNTAETLIALLESRLDAVVYRAKFVPTVFAARQFVNHGHIRVNGRRVNIPSYLVKPGDVIEVKESSKQAVIVLEAVGLSERDVPDDIAHEFHARLRERLTRLAHRDPEGEKRKLSELRDEIDLLLIAVERETANELYRNGGLKDEARRRIERDLDLREAHIASIRTDG